MPLDHPKPPGIWPDQAARFYARVLDRSDYGATASAALAAECGMPASLLDIGAGAGHPVQAWLAGSTPWFALEPNRYLRARLGRMSRHTHPALRPIGAGWEALPALGLPRCDWALAANTHAPLAGPAAFLALLRQHADRIAWLVPAQRAARRSCLGAAFPPELHGEATTPGINLVLDALPQADWPARIRFFPWRFDARFADAAAALAHSRTILGVAEGDSRLPALKTHLKNTLTPLPCGGVQLSAPKLSALMIWDT